MAPEHPSVMALIGATDDVIIQVSKQGYQGEWNLAPSVLSCQQHNDCMRDLLKELSQHMASEPPPKVDPCRNVEDPPHPLVENPDALLQEDNVLSHPM